MIFVKVHTYQAAQRWGSVEAHIAAAQAHNKGDWTMDQMKSDIHTGRVELIAVMDGEACVGAVAYVMQNRRNSRCAFVVAIGGRALASEDNLSQLSAIFRAEGATEIEGAGRESTIRLWSRLGFEPKYQVFGVKI
jgi:hypothetical protein